MAKLTEIVIDSIKPSLLAQFWESALDDFTMREYDDQEKARLAVQGFTPDSDPHVALDGPSLTLFFQITTVAKQQRNRIHLDISAREQRDPEVQRLMALGATVRDTKETYTVMLDPEGNEFCVTDRC